MGERQREALTDEDVAALLNRVHVQMTCSPSQGAVQIVLQLSVRDEDEPVVVVRNVPFPTNDEPTEIEPSRIVRPDWGGGRC